MSRARFWKLQINLDTFNSAFAALDTDSERGEFLLGLSRGMNGGKVKDDCSDPMSVGFAIGSEMRQEAEGFRQAAAINGSKRKSNENDRVVDQEVNPTVDHPGHPICNPISNNLNNNNPETPKASSASRPRKAAVKKDVSQIPPELLIGLQDLCRDWPRWSIRDDGDRQDLRAWSDPVDLWNQMVKHFPDADKALMVECGLAYLDGFLPPPSKYDRKTFVAPKFTYAMTNFYGPVKHHWDKFKEAARTRMEEGDEPSV